MLLYGNFFIATAAVIITWQTAMLMDIHIHWAMYATIFLSTLFIYLLDRLLAVTPHSGKAFSYLHGWMLSNRIPARTQLIFTGICLAVIAFWLPWKIWLWYGHLAFISLGYGIPILKKNDLSISLRDIGGMKVILIGYVWACTTVSGPLIAEGASFITTEALLLWLQRFLFVAALCIPFDIRDKEQDEKAGLLTLPSMLGAPGAKALAIGLFVLFGLISLLHYGYYSPIFIAHLISVCLCVVTTLPVQPRYHDRYLLGVIDGQLIIQPLLVYAFLKMA